MNLQDRMKGIAMVMNSNDHRLTSKEVAEAYTNGHCGTSDILTTGSLLNVMSVLGLVQKIEISHGKRFRVYYKRTGNNMIALKLE